MSDDGMHKVAGHQRYPVELTRLNGRVLWI